MLSFRVDDESERRFWAWVPRPVDDGCWEWSGRRVGRGYGRLELYGLRTDGKPVRIRAHRFSFALHFGPIPDGLFVLHRCDNPPCVNPAHLFLGTAGDNIHDMVAKGRARNGQLRGIENSFSKLTPDLVEEIRGRVQANEGLRATARRLGIGYATVCDVIHGRTWSHI